MYKDNFVVAIKHNGKILRETDDKVSLPFNSQYSILLKNKDSRKVSVTIEVDGEDVLRHNNLILDGGASQEIKGFMHDMSITNRFKFICKTEEISNYRGDRVDDGLVCISYTFEVKKWEPVPLSPHSDWRRCPPYKWNQTTYDPMSVKFCSSDLYGVTPSCDTSVCDDGITVKGAKVTQEYNYGEIGALENQSSVIVIKLQGTTFNNKKIKKSVTVKTKVQCQTCGRKSKSNATFCYNCGTFIGEY